MGRAPLLTLRLEAETKADWEHAAAEARQSLSEFIRDAVNDRLGREALKPARQVRKRRGAAECERARFHRPGTFCKTCGETP